VSVPDRHDPNPSLGAALAGLVEVAQAAGVDESVARAEGEALAATIAEPAKGAYLDWSAQTGGDRSAEDFFTAASRGRRWRSAPTTTLSMLVVNNSAEAVAYATALADVCSSACGLGEPAMRAVGNASMAAAAQLQAAGTQVPTGTTSPVDPASSAGPVAAAGPVGTPTFDDPVPPDSAQAQHFLGRLLETVTSTQTRVTEQLRALQSGAGGRPAPGAPARPGSTLDLGELDPLGPGAFGHLAAPTAPPAPSPPTADSTAADQSTTSQNAPSQTPPAQAEPAPATAPTQPAEPAPEPKSLAELLDGLDGLIGLRAVKGEIHRQVAVLRVEGLRAKAGLAAPTITRHLIFTGNPGTGKTTVARLVSGIYRALGLLSKGQLVEVDRSELVAGYLGQTAMKTAEVVARAKGGVLFIDEAYSLSGDQYGTEAIDTLVKEMEDHRDDLVVIVAGYPVPMGEFIAENPGLHSRFRTTIEFIDYTHDELVGILRMMAAEADYDLSEECVATFTELLGRQVRNRSFGNGRFARNCLEAAIGHHAWRLREVDQPTVEQLRRLEPADFAAGEDEEGAHADPVDDQASSEPAAVDHTGGVDDAGATWGPETVGWGSISEPSLSVDPALIEEPTLGDRATDHGSDDDGNSHR